MYKSKLQQLEGLDAPRLLSALDLHYYLDEDTVYVEEPEKERCVWLLMMMMMI